MDAYLEPESWAVVTWGEAFGLGIGEAVAVEAPGTTETVRVQLRDVRPLHGRVPGEVTMLPEVAHTARLETDQGATLLLRVGHFDGFEPFAALVISLRPDGTLAALGDCAYVLYTEPLERWLATLVDRDPTGGTKVDALRAYVAAPDDDAYAALVQAVHGPVTAGPQAWDDLPPEERQIDVEFTPRDVYQRPEVLEVAVRLPESWWTTDHTLCLRISIGWGSCTILHRGMVGVGRDGVALRGYTLPGEPMEVWLLGADADVREPFARLQTIDPAVLAEGRAGGGPVLTPEPGLGDLEALVAAAGRGEAVFQVGATGGGG